MRKKTKRIKYLVLNFIVNKDKTLRIQVCKSKKKYLLRKKIKKFKKIYVYKRRFLTRI